MMLIDKQRALNCLLSTLQVFALWGCTAFLTESPGPPPEGQSNLSYKVGKEIPIATRATREEEPAIAWDGTNYVVVWQDQRSDTFDIYGTRISTEGNVLDPEGIAITRGPLDQIQPKIVWNGTLYLVVWQDKRHGQDWQIYGARMTPRGDVLDPEGIPIAVGPDQRAMPSAAWDGENFFVVWERTHPAPFKSDIYGARVTPNGRVLDPEGIPIARIQEDQYYSGISWNGDHYLVVWSDKRSGRSFDIYGARIQPDGTVVDREGFAIAQAPDDQFYPAIGWNGQVHLVAWMDRRHGEVGIYGTRINSSGEVLDPEGIALSATPIFHAVPFVLSKGEEFLVVWEEEHKTTIKDIYGTRIDSQGTVLDPEGIGIYTGLERQSMAKAASDGTRYVVVWKDERAGIPFQGDIYGQVLDFSPSPPSPVSAKGTEEERLGPYLIHQISVHPRKPNVLYAATSHYGLLKSDDGGLQWRSINRGLKSFTHRQIVIDPRNPDVLYAGAMGGGMSKSRDGGTSWQEINTGLGDTAITALVIDPNEPQSIYTATESGVFHSPDGGMHWESFNQGLARSYHESFQALLLLPSTPLTLYLGSTEGLYRWDESSSRWLRVRQEAGEKITALAFHPQAHRLYAGTLGSGLLSSEDGGKNWRPVVGAGPSWVTGIAIDPVDPETLYVATADRGVLKTTDGGAHWREHNAGLSDTNVQSLAIAPQAARTLYAGTYEDGIFLSENGGQQWVKAPSLPQLSMAEILNALPFDTQMRSPAEIQHLIDTPALARTAFAADDLSADKPPPEFVKCNGCHGWTDPLLNLRRTYWRVPANIRHWAFTVKQRMSRRAGLTPQEEETIIRFLEDYSRRHAAEQHEERPLQIVRRVCGQCHSLQIKGQCVAGDCQTQPGHQTGGRQWAFVVDWMRTMGSHMTDEEQRTITDYLTATYPAQPYAVTWEKVAALPGKGWNITSLQAFGPYLYAGTEGSGTIFRSSDGVNWTAVGRTGAYRVYGLTEFQGAYYAGADTPRPEIWKSLDGTRWRRNAVLLEDQVGIISLGKFQGHLYAGTARGTIFRSVDGERWQEVAALKQVEAPDHWVRFLIEFQGKLYAGTQYGGLYRSANGTEWEEIGKPIRQERELLGLRAVAVFQDSLYVGSITHGEIWRTGDGVNWTLAFDATPQSDGGYVASMTTYKGYLYAGIRTHSGFIFRTGDGSHWEEVGNLSPHTIEAMTVFHNDLYAGTLIPPQAHIYRASVAR